MQPRRQSPFHFEPKQRAFLIQEFNVTNLLEQNAHTHTHAHAHRYARTHTSTLDRTSTRQRPYKRQRGAAHLNDFLADLCVFPDNGGIFLLVEGGHVVVLVRHVDRHDDVGRERRRSAVVRLDFQIVIVGSWRQGGRGGGKEEGQVDERDVWIFLSKISVVQRDSMGGLDSIFFLSRSVRRSILQPVCLSLYLSICHSVHLCVSLSFCLCLCLSGSLASSLAPSRPPCLPSDRPTDLRSRAVERWK